jgi:hypothetical protein
MIEWFQKNGHLAIDAKGAVTYSLDGASAS